MAVEPLSAVVERLKLVEALEVADAELGKLGYGGGGGCGFEDFVEFAHSAVGAYSVVVDDGGELGVTVVEVVPSDAGILFFFGEDFFLAVSFFWGADFRAGGTPTPPETPTPPAAVRLRSISSRVVTERRWRRMVG